MLELMLVELAEVQSFISSELAHHEGHDPDVCLWAEFGYAMGELNDSPSHSMAMMIVFGIVALIHKTGSAAQAGAELADKTREVCAAMARDRIKRSRNIATAKQYTELPDSIRARLNLN